MDMPDQPPDELLDACKKVAATMREQAEAVVDAMLAAVQQAYTRGLRDGLEGSAATADLARTTLVNDLPGVEAGVAAEVLRTFSESLRLRALEIGDPS